MAKKARESKAIRKARRKLEKQFEEQDKQISEKAIERMRQAIHIYISRHAEDRIAFKSKEISLFDENKHPAKIRSQYVRELLDNLKEEEPKTDFQDQEIEPQQ